MRGTWKAKGCSQQLMGKKKKRKKRKREEERKNIVKKRIVEYFVENQHCLKGAVVEGYQRPLLLKCRKTTTYKPLNQVWPKQPNIL